MYYKQPYSSSRRPSMEGLMPCSRLCHDKKCLKPPGECYRSHDERVIVAWKAGRGRRRCSWGDKCSYAPQYLCRYQHTMAEIFPEEPRLEKVYRNLVEIGNINMDALPSQGPTRMTHLEGLSSFSTLDRDDEIAIPGTPALFTKPQDSIVVTADNKNLALQEPPKLTHSFEALVTSVERMTDGSALACSDIVASCGALRMIFNFMRAIHIKEPDPALEIDPLEIKWLPHRLDLEWREPGTLYLSPWANDTRFKRSWGMGRGFESMTRSFDQSDPIISRSSSHHQIVSYSLGGLRCVVQAEVDAYSCSCGHHLKKSPQEVGPDDRFEVVRPRSAKSCSTRRLSTPSTASSPSTSPTKGRGKGKARRSSGRQSDPIPGFSLLQMDDAGDIGPDGFGASHPSIAATPYRVPGRRTGNSKLTVHQAGDSQPPIPISCLLEVKTKNIGSIVTLESWAAQLYFSGRGQLFSAQHSQGVFNPNEGGMIEGLESWLEEWAKRDSIQAAMGRTVALLRAIRDRLAQLAVSGDISLGPEGNGLSLLLGCDDKIPFARLYSRNDAERLLP